MGAEGISIYSSNWGLRPASARVVVPLLVPTATCDPSRASTDGDDWDAGDAHGRIYMSFRSGWGPKGREFKSRRPTNLVAPTNGKPAREVGASLTQVGAYPLLAPNQRAALRPALHG